VLVNKERMVYSGEPSNQTTARKRLTQCTACHSINEYKKHILYSAKCRMWTGDTRMIYARWHGLDIRVFTVSSVKQFRL